MGITPCASFLAACGHANPHRTHRAMPEECRTVSAQNVDGAGRTRAPRCGTPGALRQGSGVLQRIVDREPFRPRCRQQGVIGGDKQGRRKPIRLEGVPDGKGTG